MMMMIIVIIIMTITIIVIIIRCPVEDDRLLLGKVRPLITGSEDHTAFIKV